MSERRGFGRTRKLPSGRWQAFYNDPEGRTKLSRTGKAAPVRHTAPHTFDSKLDAEAWLTDERRAISAGTWTAPAVRRQREADAAKARERNVFAAYAQRWLDERHDIRPSTRLSYQSSLTHHLIPAFGHKPVTDVTAADVRAWFNAAADRPTARAHAYAVLKAIFADAVSDDVIVKTPCRIKAGAKAHSKRDPEALTLPELLALAKAMPPQHYALTLLCGLCGLRFGEAVALRREDVDLKTGTVSVRHGVVRVNGEKVIGPPKTKAAVRTVAMPKLVVDALREHLSDSISGGRKGLVFPGSDGKPLAPTALYGCKARTEKRNGKTYEKAAYGFYGAREAIGRPQLHWHDLRRTAATLGAQSGATVREMQSRLGHSTPAMALHYQQATAERDRAIAERLQATVEALGDA